MVAPAGLSAPLEAAARGGVDVKVPAWERGAADAAEWRQLAAGPGEA